MFDSVVAKAEFDALVEEQREALGTFATNAELERAVMTSPLAALAKCLGLKRLSATAEQIGRDKRTLEGRKRAFNISLNV